MPNIVKILRHGEREEHKKGSFGHDLQLTEKGRQEAFCLGQSMRDQLSFDIHTSPILRCVQTAEEILRGAGKGRIILSNVLGDPGPFVTDCTRAGPVFLEKSVEEIAQALVNQETLPGLSSLEKGANIFLSYISQVNHFPCLMISHDIIICLLACFLSKSKDVKGYMPGFLEGFSIEVITKLPRAQICAFCAGFGFLASCLWPTGYVNLQETKPAQKSSNLVSTDSFVITSITKNNCMVSL